MPQKQVILDGNEATAYIAHKLNEIIAIYPITPASPMGEFADAWSVANQKNIWGTTPTVVEMQSEAGAAGAVHGALQSGALTTTFTASQGLLLMIPNMYKIAGELNAAVFHVAARTVATHALSIFGDHSDVMATRATGFAMLASSSVQETMDFALISHAASLESRIPFVHFFDGFRTSHEIQKIAKLTLEDLQNFVDNKLVIAHRNRALSPDNPFIRGTAQNPDVFFQAREAINPYYQACPKIVQKYMDALANFTGRSYHLFDYTGHPQAKKVIVLMGSGAQTAQETVAYLVDQGEKVGVVQVRLYRPFSVKDFIKALPETTETIAVLDRTKEPGSVGEPLYGDIVSALFEAKEEEYWHLDKLPKVIGGRYGLSSKEFTPAMIKGVFEHMDGVSKKHFTVGIIDDISQSNISYDATFTTPDEQQNFCSLFYGLGSDGTVSANKNSIKIIGQETDFYTQGYFVYDSKKAGSVTISHLRFGKKPIRSAYLIQKANFIGCHQFNFLEKYDVLRHAEKGAIFLLNAPYGKEQVWDHLPCKIQQQIIAKQIQLFVIDAYEVAKMSGMGRKINTIMQTCFFAISGVLPRKEAIAKIKEAIKKTYGIKSERITEKNFKAVDTALENLFAIKIPQEISSKKHIPDRVSKKAPEFVKNVISQIMSGLGDQIPASAFNPDGTFPSGTAKWEKRAIATEVPVWDENICIQCNKCVLVCPHSVIRTKAFAKEHLQKAPSSFKSCAIRDKQWSQDTYYSLQVSPLDCTGCQLCVEVCPVKNKSRTGLKAINMFPIEPLKKQESQNWDFFLSLPEVERTKVKMNSVKGSQYLEPLFEFSGACAGCGETPYIKLVTQLFGDRLLIANATGCSSIYGGNLPTTPWTVNKDGLGPAWSNSLFEDNAEFGLGFRLTVDKHKEQAEELLVNLDIDQTLLKALLENPQKDEAEICEQRRQVKLLKEKLSAIKNEKAQMLLSLADYLVKKSVWIIGGDGWAYDIGYGGLDHVLASGKNVNILVLDTEVYSNTGGQTSKATPLGAIAKFSAGGKQTPKKDLAMQAVSYGNVYVARVAMGANDTHTIKAFLEAERFSGPSLIIAYSHCIAHGYDLKNGLRQQKLAVDSAYWPLFRFNPSLALKGENPFVLDSKDPKVSFKHYAYNETRYKMLTKTNPEVARELLEQAQRQVHQHWQLYKKMPQTYEIKN